MANYVIARSRVQEYAKWKTAYDVHKSSRTAAGVSEKHLFQDLDDPNMVTLIFEVEDLKRAEGFFTSDDLREAMQKSGVVGKPDIHFVKG
jgi:hypothetical protein